MAPSGARGGAGPHPLHTYPVWVRWGVALSAPTCERLTAGWSAADHAALAAARGRLGPAVRAAWAANHPEDGAEDNRSPLSPPAVD